MILGGLGTIFMTFVAARNLISFQGDSGVTPDPGTFLVGGKLFLAGP